MKLFILLLVLAVQAFGQGVPVLQNPTATQNIVQPTGTSLNVNTLNAKSINGTLQADQFDGADMCAKISAAISALPAEGGDVDATHFSGNQPCSQNPFPGTIAPGWRGHLSVRLGHVKIQSSVGWQILGSKVTLTGISPTATQLVYSGGASINAVLTVSGYDGQVGKCGDVRIENLYLVGNGNATVSGSGTNRSSWAHIGLFALQCYWSEFNNVWAWGTQDSGIYVQGGVLNSLRAPHVSKWDANEVLDAINGILPGEAIFAPQSGIQLDAVSNSSGIYATTAGTIANAVVEGVPGTGIVCANASNMVFLAGTSENNGQGVYIAPSCSRMTFIGMDLELNTDANNNKIDFHDDGNNTTLINLYTANQILLNSHSASVSSTGVCQGSACWLTGSSAPSGPCTTGSIFTRTDTGDFYVCKLSAWVLK